MVFTMPAERIRVDQRASFLTPRPESLQPQPFAVLPGVGFAGDSAGAMLALASALWLRDKQIDCGKVAAFCCGMGFTDYGIP